MFPHGRRLPARSWVIALAGAAFLALVLVPVASTASARPTSIPNPSPIKHIVVLYLENHSFDSILGFWCNDNPGRCSLDGNPNGGGMPSSVKLSNGAVVTPKVGPDAKWRRPARKVFGRRNFAPWFGDGCRAREPR